VLSAKCGMHSSRAIRSQVAWPSVQNTASGAITGSRALEMAVWAASAIASKARWPARSVAARSLFSQTTSRPEVLSPNRLAAGRPATLDAAARGG
jgi:hypothetical protein